MTVNSEHCEMQPQFTHTHL